MATFTTIARVKENIDASWLGTGTGQITDAVITAKIPIASEQTQSRLPNYWPFPDVDATPATPEPINELAAMRTAALCLKANRMTNHVESDSEEAVLIEKWDAELEKLRDGSYVLQREKITGEAITWGDGAPIPTDRSKLTKSTEADVIPEATLITGYRYGVDFWVQYDSRFGAWFLIKGNSGITAGTDTVAYDIDFQRKRREVATQGVRNIRIASA